jgi:hypothetical protein
MASVFSGARKDRLDLSVGNALGSASQIALFVAPVLVLASYGIGPTPPGSPILAGSGSDDANRRTDGSTGDEQRALGVVRRGVGGLPGLRDVAVPVATPNAVNAATRRANSANTE